MTMPRPHAQNPSLAAADLDLEATGRLLAGGDTILTMRNARSAARTQFGALES